MRCKECDNFLFSLESRKWGMCTECRVSEDNLANWQAKELEEQLYSYQKDENNA